MRTFTVPYATTIVDLDLYENEVYDIGDLTNVYTQGLRHNTAARSIVAMLAHRYRFNRRLQVDQPCETNLAYLCESHNAYEVARRILLGREL